MNDPGSPSIVVRRSGPLRGEVQLSGAKNSVLKLLAATTLAEGTFILRNVPRIADVEGMSDLLAAMGSSVRRPEPGVVEIDSPADLFPEAPYEIVEKMRASIVVLGPLVARFGRARVSLPGGDDFGPRPIDLTWASAGSLAGVPENHLDGSLAARLAPDEIGVRLDLATQLSQAGQYERALKEFESILASDPEQVRARYGRAVQFLHLNRERDVIDREFARVVEHPQVEQLVHWRPVTVYAFHRTANRQIDEGQFEDALRTARRGLSLSERYRPPPSDRDRENRGRSHCILAQACLAAAGNTPELRCEAREELELARSLAPAYVDGRLAKNELLRTLATEHAVNEVP